MEHIHADVCVVGAGPAGAILALLLAKQGHKVVLLERAANLERDYRGEILQPSTIRLFDQLGMSDFLFNLPHKVIDRGGIYDRDKRIMTFTMSELSDEYPHALQMNQAVLLNAILREVEKFSNFSFHMRAPVSKLLKDETGKVVGVYAMVDKNVVTVHAKITVGSDGRHSTVRRLSPFQIARNHHRSNLIWLTVDWPEHLPHELMYMLTGRNNLFMIPKFPNKMQIGYTFTKEEHARVKQGQHQEIRDLVLQYFSDLKPQMDAATEFVKLEVISLTLDHWVTDGLVLIGDAAHVMTPIGVIGINIAIADAINAANVIDRSIRDGDYSRTALVKLEHERKPLADEIQELQIRIESLIFTTNSFVSAMRPHLIKLISRTPLKNRLMKKFFFPVRNELKSASRNVL